MDSFLQKAEGLAQQYANQDDQPRENSQPQENNQQHETNQQQDGQPQENSQPQGNTQAQDNQGGSFLDKAMHQATEDGRLNTGKLSSVGRLASFNNLSYQLGPDKGGRPRGGRRRHRCLR
jgi:hypothetical protein